jgi:hypothetical protein
MVILVDLHLCSSGFDVCSSGYEKFQGSRVFVNLELIVLTSNWKNLIHVAMLVAAFLIIFVEKHMVCYS